MVRTGRGRVPGARAPRASVGERGMVLPLVALLLVGLVGMVALTVDIGQLGVNRRRLQNAADAAALGGAAYLPASPAGAADEARRLARANGLSDTEIQSVTVTRTNFDNDTIEVTVRRSVAYSFARVLGFQSGTVTAKAKVILQTTQGINTQGPGGFPYAVWVGNKKNVDNAVPPVTGAEVVFRSNQYDKKNVTTIPEDNGNPECERNLGGKKVYNCNWNIRSNRFKGYFHWKNSYAYIDTENPQETASQGGNAFGTDRDLIDLLYQYYQSGTPIWLPLVFWSSDQGPYLRLTIVGFTCVRVTHMDKTGASDWKAEVLDPRTTPGCAKGIGLPTGGQNPPPGIPNVYNYRLVE